MERNVRLFAGTVTAVSSVLAILLLAGCGGGGTQAGPSGNTVNVSMASTETNALPGTAASPSATPAAENIDHAWITVHRIALLPGTDSPGAPNDPGQIAESVTPPEEIDLLNLPAAQVGRFLDAIENVPAGTYGKIRLYYSQPKVHFLNAADNTDVHLTANGHLDIHFVDGGLVVPVSTGGGVRFFDVSIVFVLGKDGLKITVNPNQVLMRPQVFATVSVVRFAVTGTADNVDKTARTFDIGLSDGRSIPAAYSDNTAWSFNDNITSRTVSVGRDLGIAALNDGAGVFVIGPFSSGVVLLADEVAITFPHVLSGAVASGTPASGWRADNTFVLNLPADNVVTPQPSRTGARYDNVADLVPLAAGDNAVVLGANVTARGYAVTGGANAGVNAYWISIGP